MLFTFPMVMAVGMFGIVYCVIISEKINKTLIALLGAGVLLGSHILPFSKAMEHIDLNVIFLLIFMMIIVNITEKSGFFEWLTILAAKKVRAEPAALMLALFAVTGVMSAFLDNVTTILLITPISILMATQLKINPIPFLVTQVLASNIGGTATLIGDPPNIMIGSAAHFSFLDFIINLSPIIMIQMIVIELLFFVVFRKTFHVTAINKAHIMEMDEKKLINDKGLLNKSLIVLSCVIIGFLLHGWLEIEASVIAMIGAAVLSIWTRLDIEDLLLKVEWSTILFFVGLFVLVGGLEHVGFISLLARFIMDISKGDMALTTQVLLWFSGISSGIIDNIPLTATFIPVIKEMGRTMGDDAVQPLWWSLSLGACLGGNLTAIGASANVVMISIAKKNGHHITFIKFLKYGVPVTLITLIISSVYLMIRY